MLNPPIEYFLLSQRYLAYIPNYNAFIECAPWNAWNHAYSASNTAYWDHNTRCHMRFCSNKKFSKYFNHHDKNQVKIKLRFRMQNTSWCRCDWCRWMADIVVPSHTVCFFSFQIPPVSLFIPPLILLALTFQCAHFFYIFGWIQNSFDSIFLLHDCI